MFQSDNGAIYDEFLFIGVFFGDVEFSYLAPIYCGTIENLKTLGIIDLNFFCKIGTVNNGGFVSESRLHVINTLVKIKIFKHKNLPLLILSYIKLSKYN